MPDDTKPSPIGPALLEYLRNLTPQILLLALTLVAWSRVDPHKPDFSWGGVQNVLTPALLFGVFFAAFWFNTQQLLERTVSASETVDIEAIRLARKDIALFKKVIGLIPIIWRHDKMFTLRTTAAILIVFVGSITLFATAIPQAVGLLRVAGAA